MSSRIYNQNPQAIMMVCIFLFSILLSSCHKEKEMTDSVLLRIGNESLTEEDVISRIPAGLLPDDSVRMYQLIIESWMKDKLISGFAEDRLYDIERIDRLVKEYRDKLIVEEYLNRMSDNYKPKIKEEDIWNYYEMHKKDLKTEIPLVKGIFLKINADSDNKNEIKELLKEEDDSKIDILEKNWIDKAIEYDYFKDRWVDWETIKGLIPYRFGNPDQFLQNNRYFETDHEDCTYYLQITDYLPTGSEQPYSFASVWISKLLKQIEITKFERDLVENLIKKSIKENKLEAVGYDPLNHTKINNKDR